MPKLHLLARLLAPLLALAAPVAARADGLIDNVNGMTLDDKGQVLRFTGLMINRDGKISLLLKSGERRPKKFDWKLDMGGKTMVPGMIDGHGHVMGLGAQLLRLDLSDTNSLDEALAKIRTYAAANPTKWILGGGWNQERWKLGRFPTATELDSAVGDRPAWFERVDGHAAWANSRAIAAGGVTAATRDPNGGRIERAAGGKPAGVFVDAAMELINKAVPAPTPREHNAAFLAAQERLLSLGVTTAADMGTTQQDWLTYRRMGDLGLLKVRILSYASGVDTALAIAGQGPTPWLYADHLRMGGIKLYDDGALGSRGAWLKADYADAPGNKGLSFLTDDQLLNNMIRGSMDGFQIAVHAIGDRANQQVLDAIEILSDTYKGDRRWRIEHAQIVDPKDLPRFGKFGTIASMQPVHQTSDMHMAEARLGEARLAGAYAWRSMLQNGSRLAFGSDFPVESPDPWAGWAASFTRQDANGQPFGGWRPQEAVTREQGWAGFTTGAAYAGFAEDRIGRIALGMRADFLILDRDPLLAAPGDLRTTKVIETWVGGDRVWQRK
ncbi:amidohydrolase family protein [Sphingomonas psychrotolerans]|uniref:Amidohydrolase family protein n=1 Tax=Sphingomonas psychrotolerans TaxID=1327635 RepID=A0ABU3N382_9SPHN|nr:amidohydrolase family protein [Sphingomonas psychrotolerans]MDT8758736.1 amidohydrolase family protein [Sphingomonas psychrotolerans]